MFFLFVFCFLFFFLTRTHTISILDLPDVITVLLFIFLRSIVTLNYCVCAYVRESIYVCVRVTVFTLYFLIDFCSNTSHRVCAEGV